MGIWWFPFYHPWALELVQAGERVVCAARDGEDIIPQEVTSLAAEGGIRGIYGATVRAAEEVGFGRVALSLDLPEEPSPFLDVPEELWRLGLSRFDEAMEALRCALPYILGGEDPRVVFLVPWCPGMVGSVLRGAANALAEAMTPEAEALGLTLEVKPIKSGAAHR